MASSSVPGLDSIRDLFTSAERAVLEATAGRKLVAASRKQLEKTLAQARTLRDKWRDLHAGQARKTKRAAGGAQANARSRTKADAFAAGIERIQARLTEFGLVPAPVRSQPGVTKAVRQAGHRSARARVRGGLAAAAAEITRGRGAAPAVKSAAKPAAAVARPAPAAPKKPAGRKMSKKRRPAATTAAVLATGGQPLRFDVAKQRSAKASATRMKLDGKVTRRGGHVLAAGKRRQAARDQRSR
ncbi:MAG: hypothetical protein ACKOC4_03460 [Planctomycetia bacterium]